MSRKVLVVDDEKLIVKGLRFSLEQDGMEVDCAYDGEEALEKAKAGEYDIILLDLMLPKMDGLEVCQQIREFSNVPIIMLTAKGEDMKRKKYFGSNLKMYKNVAQTESYLKELADRTRELCMQNPDMELFILPSYTSLETASKSTDQSEIRLGAQNMCWEDEGQFTGEISPVMLEELDLHLVMVGHSERRHVFGESNIEENKKMLAAMKHGFTGLLCIGETKEEKGYGIADEVLRTQIKVGLHGIAAEDLDKVWIAYEPVWAIGVNGVPAPVEYAQEKHHVIRETLRELYGEAADVVPALYGGSVNLENATRLFVQPDIDGLYVGRVAWDAKRFAGLIADCLATGEK